MNIVPKSGGNTLSGSIFGTWGNGDMQGSNCADELKAAGSRRRARSSRATTSTARSAVRSAGTGSGSSARCAFQGNSNYIANMYDNKNAGDPTKWTYEPDLSRQAFKDQTWQNASGRITAQITPAQQGERLLGRAEGLQELRERRPRANATTSPEANTYADLGPMRFQQATYLAGQQQVPARGRLRLLLLALGRPRQGGPEHQATWCAWSSSARPAARSTATSPGLIYRSQTTDLFSDSATRTSPTLARGGVVRHRSTELQVRLHRHLLGDIRSANRSAQQPAVPRQQRRAQPVDAVHQQLQQNALDAQRRLLRAGAVDADRLTLQGALRYDHAWSWAPAQRIGPSASCRRRSSSRRRRSWTPTTTSRRAWPPPTTSSATARRRSRARSGKYLDATVTASNYGLANPTSRIPQNVDAHLDRRQQQLRRRTATCSTPTRRTCARPAATSAARSPTATSARPTFSNTIDPDILKGWGVRPSDWQLGRVGAARGAAARVGRGRLLPPWVPGLHRHRQPGGHGRRTSTSSA